MTEKVQNQPPSTLSHLWIHATVFGALWGGLEITLGTLMHALRVPFSGVWMAAAGTTILVAGLMLFPNRGFAMRVGVVCMLLKLVSPGVVILLPMLGIFMEAVIIEAVMGKGRVTYFRSILAGSLCSLSVIGQAIAYYYFIFGWDLLKIYLVLLEKAVMWLGAPESWGWVAVALIILLICLVGALAGIYGIVLGKAVLRLQQEEADA